MSITTIITTPGGQSPASAADSPSSSSGSAQPPVTPLSPNPANPIPVAIPEHIAHQQYLPQQPQQPSASGASPNNANNVTSPYNIQNNTSAAAAAAAANARRKPSRRANTAERRATHNAVERQRRETLNGRFLDLAALLPNLASVRRPSKSAIVNSSIALIHTQRRMRVIAGRELRALKMEADELRLEVAQWRERSGMPRGPLPEEVPRSREFLEILGTEEVDETWEGWDSTGIEEGLMEEDEGLEEGETEEDMLHHAAQVQAQQHAAALHHHQQQQQQQQQQQAQLRVQHQQQLQRHPYDGIYDPTGVAAVAAAAAYHQQHAQQQPTPPHAQPQLHPLSIPQPGSNPPSADPTKLAWASGVYPALGMHPHAAATAAQHPQTTAAAQQWAHAAQAAHSALFTPPSTAGGPGSMQQQQQQPPNPFESSASHQAFLASYQRASAAHAAQAVHAQVQAQAQHYVQLGLQQQYQAQMQAHAQAHHAAHPESPTVLQHHPGVALGAGGFPHGLGAEDDAESVGSGGHESIHSAGHIGGYGGSQAGAGSPGSDGSISSGHAHYEAAPPSAVPGAAAAAVDLLALSAGSEYPRRPAVSIPTAWNGTVTPPQTAVGGGAKRSPIAGPNKSAAQFTAMTLLA